MQILHDELSWGSGRKVIFEDDSKTFKECLENAVKAGANLEGAKLQEADLRGANLKGITLEAANIYQADLRGANLEGANLARADLRVANVEGANLKGASLAYANLAWASLNGANFEGANFTGAWLHDLNLNNLALKTFKNVKNLHKAKLDNAFVEWYGKQYENKFPAKNEAIISALKRVIAKCECGGEKTKEPHYSWCPEHPDNKSPTDRTSLVDGMEKKYRYYEDWEFEYKYPGFFSYAHKDSGVVLCFEPDHARKGYIDIQIQDPAGNSIRDEKLWAAVPDEVKYDEPLTPEKLFKLIAPVIDQLAGNMK